MKTSIAVIIPTYNRYHYLREAIISVLNQTRPADEIVVVDDGSSDNTPEIAREFPQVTYYRKENGGLPAARNYGIERTISELLVFFDDDDRLCPKALELQEKVFQTNPHVALVYGRAALIDESGRKIGEHLRNHKPPENVLGALLVDNYILIQTVMARRGAVEAVGRFRLFLGEDLDLYIRLSLAGFRFQFIDEILAEYRKLPGTMSSNKLRYASAILAMVERNVPSFPARDNSLYYTAFYHYRVGRAALDARDFARARSELQKAVRGRPGQPYFWAYCLVATFPTLLGRPLSGLQRLKRKLTNLLCNWGWYEKRWGTPV